MQRPVSLACLIVLFGASLLSGCASVDTAGFPNLAQRPFERAGGASVPAPAPAVALTDAERAAIEARIATLLAGARDADVAFSRALTAAQRPVSQARGAAVGSTGWFIAQSALSAALDQRHGTIDSLHTLDSLHSAALLADQAAAAELYSGAQQSVTAMVVAQDRRFGALLSALPTG